MEIKELVWHDVPAANDCYYADTPFGTYYINKIQHAEGVGFAFIGTDHKTLFCGKNLWFAKYLSQVDFNQKVLSCIVKEKVLSDDEE